MHRVLMVCVVIFASCAYGDESDSGRRIQMLDIPANNATMAAAVQAAAEAFSEENLAGFLECFTASTSQKLRGKMAMTFVQHDVAMVVIDTQVLSETLNRGEIAVKYSVKLSERQYTCISRIGLLREFDGWKIAAERVVMTDMAPVVVRRPSCAGGRCPL